MTRQDRRAQEFQKLRDERSEAIEQRDKYKAQRNELIEALKVLANIPIENFGLENKPETQLHGWSHHSIYVRDVLNARVAIAKVEADK